MRERERERERKGVGERRGEERETESVRKRRKEAEEDGRSYSGMGSESMDPSDWQVANITFMLMPFHHQYILQITLACLL